MKLGDRERIRPGLELLVPAVPARDIQPDEPVVVAVPEEQFVYENRRRVFYRVIGREALPDVAKTFGVSVDDLQRWNHVAAGANLHRGMVLAALCAGWHRPARRGRTGRRPGPGDHRRQRRVFRPTTKPSAVGSAYAMKSNPATR